MPGYTGSGKYFIVNNAAPSSVVDLLNGSPQPNTPINGWTESPNKKNPHQIWEIVGHHDKDDEVSIINAAALSYVTVPPNLPPGSVNPPIATSAQCYGDPKESQEVQDDDEHHHWKVRTLDDGSVTFESTHYPGKVLDLAGGNPSDDTPILVWGEVGSANQIWTLTPAS